MTDRPRPRRVSVELTSEQEERLQHARIEEQTTKGQMRTELRLVRDAADERSFTGRLRRAIHKAPMLLPDLCQRTEIDSCLMGDFLRGEAPLDSAAIDRLITVLGWPAIIAAEPTVEKTHRG